MNQQCTQGHSPLMLAAMRGSEDVARYLMTFPIDLTLRDHLGRNVLHLAMLHSHKLTCQLVTFIQASLDFVKIATQQMNKINFTHQNTKKTTLEAIGVRILEKRNCDFLNWCLKKFTDTQFSISKSNLDRSQKFDF